MMRCIAALLLAGLLAGCAALRPGASNPAPPPPQVDVQIDAPEPLRKLLDARTKLSDLRNKLAGNDKLEDILGEVMSNTDKLKKLGTEAKKDKE